MSNEILEMVLQLAGCVLGGFIGLRLAVYSEKRKRNGGGDITWIVLLCGYIVMVMFLWLNANC